ncbi:MAG: hypothetical protein KDC39_12650 [Actinobacteria bacterium]|nr:hypothetical protein [Actinomycetota bacterium]
MSRRNSILILAMIVVVALATIAVLTLRPNPRWTHPDYTDNGVPIRGQVLFGASTGEDVGTFEAQVGGTLGIHRSYFGPDELAVAREVATADLSAGRLPWISFKLPLSWAEMANGAGDDWARALTSVFGELPGPVWLAFHHEPEGDGELNDWLEMQRHLSAFVHDAPNLAFTLILSGYVQLFDENSQQSMDSYWPGSDVVDVLAFDPYNWYDTTSRSGRHTLEWTELDTVYDRIVAWLNESGNAGVPWAIAETGYTDSAAWLPEAPAVDGTSPGSGAAWLERGYRDMKARGGVALSYFSVPPSYNNEPPSWTWPIQTQPKRDVFAHVLAGSPHINDPR